MVEVLKVYKNHLESGQNARTAQVEEIDKEAIKDLQLLTAKPVMYVCNVDEQSVIKGNDYTKK